ncbi:uncharacterized protein LOC144170078 [Haemaphysalis longicornis]
MLRCRLRGDMASPIKISFLALLTCWLAAVTSDATADIGHHHTYAGGEYYPHGFMVRTIHDGEDSHGHRSRGYGHGHRDYVHEPEYVVRSPYSALLQQSESQQLYAGRMGIGGTMGHEHAAFMPGVLGGQYLMRR